MTIEFNQEYFDKEIKPRLSRKVMINSKNHYLSLVRIIFNHEEEEKYLFSLDIDDSLGTESRYEKSIIRLIGGYAFNDTEIRRAFISAYENNHEVMKYLIDYKEESKRLLKEEFRVMYLRWIADTMSMIYKTSDSVGISSDEIENIVKNVSIAQVQNS